MKKTFVTAAFLLASLTVGATAFADPVPHLAEKLDKVFARLDANKDGFISRAEADAGKRLAKHFARVDANNDGFVSRDELATALQRRRDHRQARRAEDCKKPGK